MLTNGYEEIIMTVESKRKYNSLFEIDFQVEHNYDLVDEIPVAELIKALEEKIARLKVKKFTYEEYLDTFDHISTYEI